MAARPKRLLLREMAQTSRPLACGAIACVVVAALVPVALAIATGVAVGAVPAAVRGGLQSAAGGHLVRSVVLVGGLLALWQTLSPMQDALVAVLARRVQARRYRRTLAATFRPRTVAHVETPELLDLVHAATLLTPGGPADAVRGLLRDAGFSLTALAALAVLCHFHWWLALVLLVTELILRRQTRAVYGRLVDFRVHRLGGLRRAEYLRGLAVNPEAAKETRIFGLGLWVVGRFRGAWLGTMAEVWRQRRGHGRLLVAAAVPVQAAMLWAAWLMGHAALGGHIGIGALVTYFQALLSSGALCASTDDVEINEGAAVLEATRALEEAVDGDPRLALPGDGAVALDSPRHDICFEGVSFRYSGQSADVLQDLDLVIPAGRSLAIVGENGAGKTTLVKLLSRLYDPTGGRILVDGTDLASLDAAAWQGRVSAVFQDFVRFPLTAAENVGFGAALGEAHDRAADLADASALIAELPSGWHTILTRELAGGVDLSGGEWQRVALARALFKSASAGGGLLILDEPTAQLDPRAEASFIDGFLDATAGCTTVVISHRFSTVRRADRIVVIDGGRIVESGSHAELVAARGRYAQMFALQADRFSRD